MHQRSVTSRTDSRWRLLSPAGSALRLRYTADATAKETNLPRLIIRSSDIHAAGCFALEPIKKGTRLLEYEGERISKDEGDLRYEGRPFTYLFGIGRGDVVIDGHGMAMFVNHSCNPNCETDEIGGRVSSRRSATSRRARNSPTTTGCTMATMTRHAIAAAANAAAACTLRRS